MHQHFPLYVILTFPSILTGWYVSSYGVLIPYYSQASGQDQTYFSFIFLVRSVSFTLGSIIIKYLVHSFQSEKIYIFNAIVTAGSLFCCTLSVHPINLTIMLFLSALCIMSNNILSASLTIKLFKGHNPQFWMLIRGIAFGAGTFIAPLMTMLFELNTYVILALLEAIVIVPIMLKYRLPNVQEQKENEPTNRLISRRSELYICLMMFLIPIQEGGFASWLPTYAIKAGISQVQDSSIYSIYYGLPNSISRFVWVFLVTCSITKRLKIITTTITIFSVLLVILQSLQLYTLLCTIGPIIFGLMVGCFLSFCLTLPLDHNFHSNTANNANFMMAYCVGEGLLLAPVGYLMRYYNFKALVYAVLVCCLISSWGFQKAVSSLEADAKEEGQKLIENQVKL